MVDIILKGKPITSDNSSDTVQKSERISSIAQRAIERERQLSHTPFSPLQSASASKESKAKPVENKAPQRKAEKPLPKSISEVAEEAAKKDNLNEDVNIVFKKALTEREQMVFNYFVENKNKVVYAKDLAMLLDLPRDYVYKYIKNLRTKIEGENLQNADSGGFVFNL